MSFGTEKKLAGDVFENEGEGCHPLGAELAFMAL